MDNKNLDPGIVSSNYTSKEPQEIRYDFSPVELNEFKDQLTNIAVQRSKKESLLKEIAAILKKEETDLYRLIQEVVSDAETSIDDTNLEKLNKFYGELLEKVSKGYEFRVATVYTLDYADEGFLRFYFEDGTFYGERRIAGRHQLSIHSNTVKSVSNE